MADALVSGTSARKGVEVRPLFFAQQLETEAPTRGSVRDLALEACDRGWRHALEDAGDPPLGLGQSSASRGATSGSRARPALCRPTEDGMACA